MNMRSVRNWWEVWDIQVVTLSSLLLQILLIFSAPLRKQVSTGMIVFPMWLAYLLADAVPVYAMGLISHRKSSSCCSEFFFVFWAPFLLLHLGGPDTITAFALEDNELWHRHLLNLVVQCCVFLYAFYLSFPGNKLWLPTVLIFVAGFIKYAERTCCLYLASRRGLANSMFEDRGTILDRLVEEHIEPPSTTDDERINLLDLEIILRAHEFHKTFKGVIADQRFSPSVRSSSRHYFLGTSARDAFKIVEVELNFFYEILYTKVLVVQGKFGFPLRIASFAFVSVTLALFNKHDKEGYRKFDVGLTYILLGGAIALDALSSLMMPFSDWCAVLLSEPHGRYNGGNCYKKLVSKLKNIFCKLFRIERQRWSRKTNETEIKFPGTFSTSWSESIPQYNLLDNCLRPRSNILEKILGLIGLQENILDSIKCAKSKDFGQDLRGLIFEELKMKSYMAKDLETRRKIDSSRGEWILRRTGCTNLLPWIVKYDYDESILLWHIATDLLYNTDGTEADQEKSTTQGIDTNGGSPIEMDFKGLSKVLSDYMLYLLIMQTTIMSTVAGIGQKRYNQTFAEAKRHFLPINIETTVYEEKNIFFRTLKKFYSGGGKKIQDKVVRNACERLLVSQTDFEPSEVKTILYDACLLAKFLNRLGADKTEGSEEGDITEEMERLDKWRLICRVWIEMMCYAACQCKGSTHAAELSKGGQLITLVWLLMAHFGLGDHFQMGDWRGRIELNV